MSSRGRGRVSKLASTLVFCASLLLLLTLPIFWTQPNPYVQVFSVVDFSPSRTHHDVLPAHFEKPLHLEKHVYTSDGLLIVNLNGPHPIFELMRNAEAAWNKKLTRASKTLAEAVAEYRRRYKRAPPLGFDKWSVTFAFMLLLSHDHISLCAGGTLSSSITSSFPTSMMRYTMISKHIGVLTQWILESL